jgi:hypothetical protein
MDLTSASEREVNDLSHSAESLLTMNDGNANSMLCLRSEDAFVLTYVTNLLDVKVLYVQQDLRYEISIYWRFSV